MTHYQRKQFDLLVISIRRDPEAIGRKIRLEGTEETVIPRSSSGSLNNTLDFGKGTNSAWE